MLAVDSRAAEIVEVRPEDLPAWIPAAEFCYAESQMPGRFDPAHWLECWTTLIEQGRGVVFGVPDRVILGGVLSRSMNTGELSCCESFWATAQGGAGYGAFLMARLEAWGRERGATILAANAMTHFAGCGRLEKLLRLLGFRRYEVAYLKELR